MLEEIKIPKFEIASRLVKKKRRRRKLYYTTPKERARSRAQMRGAKVLSRRQHSYGETSKALDFHDEEVDDIVGDGLDKIIEEIVPVVGRDEGNIDGEEDDESDDDSEDENEELNQGRQDLVSISYY